MVKKRKGEKRKKKKNINDRDLLPIVRRIELAPSHPFSFFFYTPSARSTKVVVFLFFHKTKRGKDDKRLRIPKTGHIHATHTHEQGKPIIATQNNKKKKKEARHGKKREHN